MCKKYNKYCGIHLTIFKTILFEKLINQLKYKEKIKIPYWA